jgi:hypothetical protein
LEIVFGKPRFDKTVLMLTSIFKSAKGVKTKGRSLYENQNAIKIIGVSMKSKNAI